MSFSKKLYLAVALTSFISSSPLCYAKDAKCPDGTHWTKVTPDSKLQEEQELIRFLVKNIDHSNGEEIINKVLDNSDLDESTLRELLKQLEDRFQGKSGDEAKNELIIQAVYQAISLAKQKNLDPNAEIYMCVLNKGFTNSMTVSASAAGVHGEVPGDVGAPITDLPNKFNLTVAHKTGEQNKVQVTYNMNLDQYTVPANTDAAVVKSSALTKNVPASNLEDSNTDDSSTPFTNQLKGASNPDVGASVSDILALDTSQNQKLIMTFGMTGQTSAAVALKDYKTQIQATAYSGVSPSKTDQLPEFHSIDSFKVSISQGIGTHAEAGASFNDQNTFQGSGAKATNYYTQYYTTWLNTNNSLGRGAVSTRTIVDAQENDSNHQVLGAVLQDMTYSLAKNRFVGEVVVAQQDPTSSVVSLKSATPISPEVVSEFMLGYERKVFTQSKSVDAYVGASYTYSLAEQGDYPVGDNPNSFEVHLRVSFKKIFHSAN